MLSNVDPWRIQPEAYLKYDEQFLKLQPIAGFITGEQAKALFLQSGLPPQILAIIWNLADMNADGKMDRHEFAVAMHLIQHKLKGGELPAVLPPSLKAPLPPGPALPVSLPAGSSATLPKMTPSVPPLVPPTSVSPQPSPALLGRQRSASVSSQDSLVGIPPTALTEWAIPQPSKLKYTQVFNSHDRTRTGFLTGAQARSILLQSGLPQPVLAQIWNLSDIDTDGRLTCEEFVVAMYLIDTVKAGDPLPSTLPYELVPPSLRRRKQRSTSIQSGMSNLYIPPASSQPLADLLGGPPVPSSVIKEEDKLKNMATFEDKRRENFEKGQAELERRRLALLESQRKEQEERQRKEREEQERKEKIRLEQEKRRQQELERQLARQREIEQEREEQRRKALEQREAARKEMERQRQLEWERQRQQELQAQRQKEQENVCHLKNSSKNLTFELSQLTTQVDEMKQKVAETRQAVAQVKSEIDGMRGERDAKMSELNSLKLKIKELNNKLLLLNQEKLNLGGTIKALHQNTASSVSYNVLMNQFNSKQIALHQLRNTLANIEREAASKRQDIDHNNNLLKELQDELLQLSKDQENVYSVYEQKRQLVLNLKNKAAPQEPKVDVWPEEPQAWDTNVEQQPAAPTEVTESKMLRYRVLYRFDARNEDELSIMPGDIILVPESQSTEPGWLTGELQGQKGWFPESYVELVTDTATISPPAISEVEVKRPLEGISEAPENGSTVVESTVVESSVVEEIKPEEVIQRAEPLQVKAIFPWVGKKEDHLSFPKGAIITVSDQQDVWWYGELPDTGQAGWFLKSYVKPLDDTTDLEARDGVYYIAAFTYESMEPGDLTFQQGELILVTQTEGDWWTGTLHGKTGIFPSNYVQLAEQTVAPETIQPEPQNDVAAEAKPEEEKPENLVHPPQQEEAKSGKGSGSSKKPEIVYVLANYTATGPEQLTLEKGQLIQVRKKSHSGWWEGEMQVKGKKRQVGWFPASYVKPLGGGGSNRSTPDPHRALDSPVLSDKVVAKYDYKAQQPDELAFEKGQVITLLGKEDAAWWKGELNGNIGLFPASYVRPYTS